MLTHHWAIYVVALMAGAVAGAINTLAGSGSTLTLPMLIFLGLPADVANGTNRVGVVLQNIVGMVTLRKGGKLPLDANMWKLVVPTLLGGGTGAMVAADLSPQVMSIVIGLAMAFVLVLLLAGPSNWGDYETTRTPWWLFPVMVAVGFYGGFVQAGVGVLLLASLVAGAHYDAVTANGVKLVLTFLLTLVALPIFAMNGQVDWELGFLMASGQGVGAYFAARFATKSPNAGIWIKRLLVVVIVATLVKLALTWSG
jgi:uncharacterized membrane protein YfcA